MTGRAPGADFTIAAQEGEMARVDMDAAAMRQAADATKGHYYSFSEAGQLADDLPEGRQVPLEDLPAVPLWNRWPVVLLFLCFWWANGCCGNGRGWCNDMPHPLEQRIAALRGRVRRLAALYGLASVVAAALGTALSSGWAITWSISTTAASA